MTDSTLPKVLALWLAGLAVLALFGGGVLGVAFLGVERSPEAMDDLRVSNDDDGTHRVRIEAVRATASDESPVAERAVTLEPSESVSFDIGTEAGETYRLSVTVDDRRPKSFEVRGPDDHCTTEVHVESNATVETVMACA